jgi:hypothetical protein
VQRLRDPGCPAPFAVTPKGVSVDGGPHSAHTGRYSGAGALDAALPPLIEREALAHRTFDVGCSEVDRENAWGVGGLH